MKRTAFLMLLMLLVTVTALAASTLPPPHPSVVTPDPWPKTTEFLGAKYTIYQPQLDSWDEYNLEAHAAVSVLPTGATDPQFGVINITASTWIDRTSRTVYFNNITVTSATFPANPEQATAYQSGFQSMEANGPSSMSLDRLEAALSILGAEKKARQTPVKNEPPKLVFSQSPALLVTVDGEPAWRQVEGTTFERAIDTRALILWDPGNGKLYLHLYDGFVTAPNITGPWDVAASVPPGVAAVAKQLGADRVVDLMTGQPDPTTKKLPSLKKGAPRVFVATTPTELVISEGAPNWVPIAGTMLLYVNNTTANIFKNLNDQQTYLLVTGRWFRAPGFNGPWQYVPAGSLPPDFANIPDDSPKENVKASIPGTPQSKEALIAAQIPQSASVDRSKLTFTPTITGQPELKPIPDTTLMYVVNSPDPIIMVAQDQWYSVQNGVWFTGPSLQGPWIVASSVPAAIYAIPPSSPLYYVTYVKIYSVTPQFVVVGYTPGYMGTVVSSDGMVVYGTGYTYAPYIGTTVWYPPPVTYGYAANVTYTPWTGWAVGFGFGWGMGVASASWCAPAPYWGPYAAAYGYHGYSYGAIVGPHGAAVWGAGGWAATSGNVYQHWGSTSAVTRSSGGYNAWTGNAWSNKVGTSYNSTTGRVSAGQKASVSNVYNGNYASGQRGATYNPSTGVSAKGGSVTTGNASTGKQNTASWGKVTGPGGQSASGVKVDNNYYGDHNGNVYKYNSTTGTAEKYNGSGSWSSVDKPTSQSLQSQATARSAGDSKSAASSWGSSSWGGGFNKSAAASSSAPKSSGSSGGWGGGERSSGGSGWGGGERSSGGGGGWDRGSSGVGGGGHSWGGGSFGGGGGGFHGGGRR